MKPTVKVSGVPASAYKVTYSSNTKVGTAKVTIKATDPAYKGKLAAAKTGGTKYQVQYRVKGTAKWKTLNTKKQTFAIRKLKKGKQYQVRIRACKKVGTKTYYGAWSTIKVSAKVK